MTREFATAFAREWVKAWNAHDIEKILSHYSEDFIIETPMAIKLYPQSHGIVVGKSEVRKYWTIGLERSPDLKFELLDLLIGVNSIGLHLMFVSVIPDLLFCHLSKKRMHKAVVRKRIP